MSDTLLTASATEIARRIRERAVTSEEAVEAHIEAIRARNPRLNAMVRDRFDAARSEARAADRTIAREGATNLPPLFGVPFTVKESIALTGMPHTAGLVSRAKRGVVAERDAPTVARMRAIGAIPLGVTNTSELCMWMESDNKVYGRTGNAYDPARVAGGSSGGEGSIVGAGASPFGIGADIGGSIRMPAFFNGVFGHKSSSGLIPNTGNYPMPHGAAMRYLSTGPLCRRAEDLALLVAHMAGPDGEDEACEARAHGLDALPDLHGLTVWDVRETILVAPDASLLAAQSRAAEALSRRGARVQRASVPSLRAGIEIWAALMDAAGGPSYAWHLGEGAEVSPSRELVRWLVGRSPHTLPSVALALVEGLPKYMPGRSAKTLAVAERLRGELRGLLGERSVMLFPSHAQPAPKHHAPKVPPVQWGYTGVFNTMELPVTQVPLGLDARGVPLGVQVVGAHGRDALTLAVARALEDEFGGWVPPRA